MIRIDIERELNNDRKKLLSLLNDIKQDIEKYSPLVKDNKLVCTSSHNTPQYFVNGEYVKKKDLTMAKEIAQLDYCKRMEKKITERLRVIDNAIRIYSNEEVDSIYNKMCQGRKALIKPYITPKDEYRKNWENLEYEPYNRWEGVTSEFYTEKGERVRSKSELIIANEFARYDIPYRYEFPLILDDGTRKTTIHPDFVVLNRRTLKEFVVEHLGMMDKNSYYNPCISKIDLLERNGYLLGVNYIVLHETSTSAINVQVLRKYIFEYLT